MNHFLTILSTFLILGFATAPGYAIWFLPWTPREIDVRNDTCKTLKLRVHYHDHNDDTWKTFYYIFDPGKNAYLSHNDENLKTRCDTIYF